MYATAARERDPVFDLDVDWRPIAAAARTLWTLVGLAVAIPVLLALTVALAALFDLPGLALGLALTVAGGVVVRWSVRRRHRAWGYAVRSQDLVLRRGLLIRRLTIVPLGRMQFVDLHQGPLDRWLGVVNLRLHTAAAATDASVPMLPLEEAEMLRDDLLRRSGATRGS